MALFGKHITAVVSVGCFLLSSSIQASEIALIQQTEAIKSCWRTCPEEALAKGDKALAWLTAQPELSQEAVDQFALIAGYLPRVHIDRGQHEPAEAIINKFLDLKREPTKIEDTARALVNLGIIYRNTGRNLLARDIYEQALDVYTRVGDLESKGNTLNNLALVSQQNGDKGEAIKFLLEALPLVEQYAQPQSFSTTLSNIGFLYTEIGEYDSARDYLDRAQAIVENTSHVRKQIEVITRRSTLETKLEQYERAREYALQGIALAKEHQAFDLQRYLTYQIGVTWYEEQEYEIAKQTFLQARDLLNQSPSMASQIRIDRYLALIAFRQGRLEDAKSIASEALIIAEQNGIGISIYNLQALLVDVYQADGDFEASLATFEELFNSYKARVETDNQNRLSQYSILLQEEEKTAAF